MPREPAKGNSQSVGFAIMTGGRRGRRGLWGRTVWDLISEQERREQELSRHAKRLEEQKAEQLFQEARRTAESLKGIKTGPQASTKESVVIPQPVVGTTKCPNSPAELQESGHLRNLREQLLTLSEELEAWDGQTRWVVGYLSLFSAVVVFLLMLPNTSSSIDSFSDLLMVVAATLAVCWLMVKFIVDLFLLVFGFASRKHKKELAKSELSNQVARIYQTERAQWEDHKAKLRAIAEAEAQLRRDSERRKALLVDALDPFDYERWIAEQFRNNGYEVRVTRKTGDGGVDLWLSLSGRKIAVQCKRYRKDNPVSRPDIQKFIGALITEKADEGIFVTTSYFTQNAERAVKESPRPIKLMARDEVLTFLAVAGG